MPYFCNLSIEAVDVLLLVEELWGKVIGHECCFSFRCS
jgi:hypothetical protein